MQAREKGVPGNDPLLREKADQLAKVMNVVDFEATNGLILRWKTRHAKNWTEKKLLQILKPAQGGSKTYYLEF